MSKCQLYKTGPNTFQAIGNEFNGVEVGEIFNVEFNGDKQRSQPQNASIHLYCGQLAQACNDAGYDKQAVYKLMKAGFSIAWTKDAIKTDLWHPIQEAMFQTASTAKLERKQVSDVYVTLNRWTGENLGLSVPFPSRLG